MANKLVYVIKYLLFAIIFLFFSVLQNNLLLSNISNNLIPDFSAFLIFYSFFVKKNISYFGVFLLCVINDVIKMLPTGISAISVLLTCKLIEVILSRTTLEPDKNVYVTFFMYFLMYNMLELFLMTYLYDRYFIPSFLFFILSFIYFIAFRYAIESIHKLIAKEK